VDGGGIDGGNGTFFANYGDDVHAVGSLRCRRVSHPGAAAIMTCKEYPPSR
jgi:hypothetical protein